ncbi:carbohydrate ABC transporter permease [Anaerocolumna xylanovorans]|uniref:Carbohydrate ABC transporter membrane protein 2, CUT1 family (TC 3.A.1.1.-) n=1 Tax=Anaerocolumna xylanovorans DSM 12503 TaxID=1121345 RepID=A0A1M7YCP6_9FIRM|nr:carbohydrate ABC transporter permease [Anaerocolumna xylanovorans]SHO50359.1 carbohydrate ABC transporter membrane protein 2, CUT1 family (TC 3.A.1.1.-) [Anaerocolumna xylanovorans DSM 12503]
MKKKAGKIIFSLIILFFLVIQLYPILWLFMASIKPTVELASTPFSFPHNPTLMNFIKVFKDGKIGLYMWNSLKVTGISLLLIVALSSTAGFALAKFNFRATKKVYAFFTFGIMVPVQITLIPLFIFYSKIGILNTSFSLILPQVGFALPLSVMMFYSFYSFLPNELLEAAIVDGCSTYRIFAKIVFPLTRNTIITIASMYSILIWNDFIFANTFISDSAAKTVAMGLKDYVGAFGNVDWGSTFAAITIAILPPMIVYFVLNRWVTAGMTMGATKG